MSSLEARAFYSELLDGEQSAAAQLTWREQLADDPALATDYAQFVAGVGALRSLAPAPLSEARVAALMAPLEGERAVSSQRLGAPAGLAAAAALLLALAWSDALWPSWDDSTRVPSEPASATLRHEAIAQAPTQEFLEAPAPARGESRDLPNPEQLGLPAEASLAAAGSAPSPRAALDADRLTAEPELGTLAVAPAILSAESGGELPDLVFDPAPRPASSTAEVLRPSSERSPRPRSSSALRLVQHVDHTQLVLQGEIGSLVPQLIELLADGDPQLAELARGRLALLRDDLIADGTLSPSPQLVDDEDGALVQHWQQWWNDAQRRLPSALPSDVL